jgi:hypothetical protein
MAKKTLRTLQIITDTLFENFTSLSLIDATEANGFQIKGGSPDSVWIFIPTGIPYNVGKEDLEVIDKLYVKAANGVTLNVSATVMI